jgi:hypothetical protein
MARHPSVAQLKRDADDLVKAIADVEAALEERDRT